MSEPKKGPWKSWQPWAVVTVLLIIVIVVAIPPSEEPKPEINYTLYVYTDKEEYGINEDVNISGFLMYGEDPVVNWNIGVSTYIKNFPHLDQLKTNEDGYFNTKVYIPGTTSEGLHKILAVASGLGVWNESYFTISLDGAGITMTVIL
jgi:hypothetical protein